ncbi:serine/threonine-protein kinase [Dactylosporangium matsuzakiense]|uniref:non-specific serine/threonine protein kinase n=1 Tax=Dactylosporangium matsuzakiense TaxID=53360 RepID=A0A9W6KGL7_9ACTN|nr:protein kinase [Dactylosporangium matsuzakiense]UWZ42234.1 protein kinase [Dactylosporangium matsuzakiense]GLK99885.1 hypothetical protein GCM10017581_016260 [Dactylosporangium matsuzakiense]
MELQRRYRMDRIIGSGDTAEVWRGHDMLLQRPVAVRLLRGDRAERAEQFLAAGRAAAHLSHPNTAAVYDVDVNDLPGRGPTPFVVMELAAGPSLATRIGEGPLPWPAVLRIGAEVAAALSDAHDQWICHRRLTPEKVMLTDVGVKILGFTGDFAGDFDAPARDVHALGLVLDACITVGEERRLPRELRAIVDSCVRAVPGGPPASSEVAVCLARLADATVVLPDWSLERHTALAPSARRRVRGRWAIRATVLASAVTALVVGAVAALGQVVPGLPWFGHPPEVAAVPPDDAPCGRAVLEPAACRAVSPAARPAAPPKVPQARLSSDASQSVAASPSIAVTTTPSPSPSLSPSTGASRSPSARPTTSASVRPSPSMHPSRSAPAAAGWSASPSHGAV